MRPRRQCSLRRGVDWMNDADDDHVCAPPQTVQRLLDVLDGADDDVTVGRRLEHMMSLELKDDVTGTER